MKYLLLGAKGQLGTAFQLLLRDQGAGHPEAAGDRALRALPRMQQRVLQPLRVGGVRPEAD